MIIIIIIKNLCSFEHSVSVQIKIKIKRTELYFKENRWAGLDICRCQA